MESSRETPTGRSGRPTGLPASARVSRFLRRRQHAATIDSLMADLARLEASLRTDIRDLDAAMHRSSDTLGERIARLEQAVADLQRALHG